MDCATGWTPRTTSVVSLKRLEQRMRVECSSGRKENTHAHWPTDPTLGADRRRTRDVGTLGAAADDGPGTRAARPRDSRVRGERDEHAHRSAAAGDQANGREMAQPVPRQAIGWAAR